MKIYISTIPFSGMKIDGHLPLAPLNSRLAAGGDIPELEFTEPPVVDLTLTRAFGGVSVRGLVTGQCRQSCATCADPQVHEVTAELEWILQSPAEAAAGNEDSLDDPGIITYDGDHIDLEEYIQEALILPLSPFWHPPRDENERCVTCQRDCSMSAWTKADDAASGGTKSLGKLLEGAIQKGPKRGR